MEENTPGLVLMDIKLKGETDGIQAAQEIRNRFDIPVVYLTAYGDVDTLKRARATEPYGYIIKPVSERELHSNVEIALYKHEAEKKLKKADEEKLEAFGTFAWGIAHDFNNLFQVSIGYIDSAMQKCDAKDKKCLESLNRSTKHLKIAGDLSKKYLKIFKSSILYRKKINLSSLIEKSIESVSIPGSIKLSYDPSRIKETAPVYGNKEWLHEMFSNLLNNAIETMEKKAGATLEITIEDILLDPDNDFSLKAGSYVKIKIRDEGKGIPEEDLAKVFDPYFSTKDNPTKKGLGLGLAFCLSAVKNHDGYIDIASQVDKGTTVTVYLPAYSK